MNDGDDLHEWAAAYRRAGQPSAALRTRIALATGVRARPIPRWRGVATHVGIGAGVAIAALVVLSWVGRTMVATQDVRDDHAAPYRHDDAADVQRSAEGRATVPAELVVPPTIPTPAPTPPTDIGPKRTAGAATSAPVHDTPTPHEVDDGGDLESLRRLRAAEALLTTDPARALALLEAHGKAYPSSAMALEREALWIRAACRTGTTTDLAARRTAFAKHPGGAAYRPAIEKDCTPR